MTDMTLGRWSHVRRTCFSIPFLQSSCHREWQPAKPRTDRDDRLGILQRFPFLATTLALAMIAP